jgi:hypothetical protein
VLFAERLLVLEDAEPGEQPVGRVGELAEPAKFCR